MWCFRKPGREASILSELQRQQRCSQFCDTLLKAEGIMVPAHSLVLSSLCSNWLIPCPRRPSYVLELGSFSASTLLRLVQLLYTGRTTGEGDLEKQQVLSAARRMGIDGLVEVGDESDSHKTDVGVQTDEGIGSDSTSKKDSWTQTEDSVVQSLPYVSLPFICTQDDVKSPSAPDDSGATGCDASSYNLYQTPERAGPPSCSTPAAAAGPEWGDAQVVQFQDNIPGFINCFLKPETVRGRGRGGKRRRQTGSVTFVGRGRRPKKVEALGVLTQTVDVQNVRGTRQHLRFRHRWGLRGGSRGKGGGSAGRHPVTRERLNVTEPGRKRERSLQKVWDFDNDGSIRLVYERSRKGRRGSPQKTNISLLLRQCSTFSEPAEALLHTTSLPPPEEHLLEDGVLRLDRPDPLRSNGSINAASYPFGEYLGLDLSSAVERDAGNNISAVELPQGQEDLVDLLENLLQTCDQHDLTTGEDEIRDGERETQDPQPDPQISNDPTREKKWWEDEKLSMMPVVRLQTLESMFANSLLLKDDHNFTVTYFQNTSQQKLHKQNQPRKRSTSNEPPRRKRPTKLAPNGQLSLERPGRPGRSKKKKKKPSDVEKLSLDQSETWLTSCFDRTEEPSKKLFTIRSKEEEAEKRDWIRVLESQNQVSTEPVEEKDQVKDLLSSPSGGILTSQKTQSRNRRARADPKKRSRPRKTTGGKRRARSKKSEGSGGKKVRLDPGSSEVCGEDRTLVHAVDLKPVLPLKKKKKPSDVEKLSLDQSETWLTSCYDRTEEPSKKLFTVRSKEEEEEKRDWIPVLESQNQVSTEPVEEKDQVKDLLSSPSGGILTSQNKKSRNKRARADPKKRSRPRKTTGEKKRRARSKKSEGSGGKKVRLDPGSSEACGEDRTLVHAVDLKPVLPLIPEGFLSEVGQDHVDVVGGSSPGPEVVTIDWGESPESEDEIIDVI